LGGRTYTGDANLMEHEIFVRDLASSRHFDRKNAVRDEFRDI